MNEILTPEKTPVRGLLAGIYREIMTDEAHLPSMPDVAIRIRASMQTTQLHRRHRGPGDQGGSGRIRLSAAGG